MRLEQATNNCFNSRNHYCFFLLERNKAIFGAVTKIIKRDLK